MRPITNNWPMAILLAVGCHSVATGSDLDLVPWIDQRMAAREAGATPVVDDATFLRRVHLDLTGRIPSVSQLRDFTADSQPDKRARVVAELVRSERFGRRMGRVWRRVLMPPSGAPNATLASALDAWLERQFSENRPYDQWVRQLVTAGGAEASSNAGGSTATVAFLQSTGGQPANMASSVSRAFLGVRLECAQCHDHPFADWRQQDFWGMAAFFSGTQFNARRPPEVDASATPTADARRLSITDEDGKTYPVALLWDDRRIAETIGEQQLPRQFFADWLTSADNPHFAATAVNRVWQCLCGDGLTDSVDDLDQAAPADRARVLDGLAKRFAESGFDMRALVCAICQTRYYQRRSERSAAGATAPRPLKVLTPEQVFDSLEVALALPVSRIDRGPRYNGLREALVARMEEAMGERPVDFRSGIPQALKLMNGPITTDAADLDKSRTLRAVIDAPFLETSEKIDTLFLAVLSRRAHAAERTRLMAYLASKSTASDRAEAYSEIMWALINSPEFVLIR